MTITTVDPNDLVERSAGLRARYVHLNAARGIAAVIVALDHYFLLFLPHSYMTFFHTSFGSLFAWSVNSAAAVFFFFTLSAFVLTRKYFGDPRTGLLVQGAVKRFPRLYVSSALSIAIAYAVLALGLNYGDAASQLTQSDWLAWVHGNKSSVPLVASATGALKESFLVLLLPDRALYNLVLWTMMFEFWGGILCFGLAALLIHASRFGNHLAVILAAVVLALFWNVVAALPESGALVAVGTTMIMGCALAFCDARGLRLPPWMAWPAVIAGLVLCAGGTVWYEVACGVLVLIGLVTLRSAPPVLAGRFAQWLGDVSFPLYLVHVIVLVSISSGVFVTLHGAGVSPTVVHWTTFFVTIVACLLGCIPFVRLERWWLATLNGFVRKIG